MAKTFRERTKQFTFKPLPYALRLVVSNDVSESIMRRMDKYRLEPMDDDTAACVYAMNHGNSFMFMPERPQLNWVVHESSHVVWYMLQYAGVGFDKEILAYYTGNLAQDVWAFAWNLPVKRKTDFVSS